MPVLTCSKDGVSGHKWGDQGVCFMGDDSKERAAEVGRAIAASEKKIEKKEASFKQMVIGKLEQWKHNLLNNEPFFELDETEPKEITIKSDKKQRIVYKSVDIEKRLVTGVVLEPETFDTDNEIYSAEVIEKAAFDFMANGPIVGKQHQEKAEGVVVESFIAVDNTLIGENPVIKGSWIMTVKVMDDDLWEDVKLDKMTGFSVGGTARGEYI